MFGFIASHYFVLSDELITRERASLVLCQCYRLQSNFSIIKMAGYVK